MHWGTRGRRVAPALEMSGNVGGMRMYTPAAVFVVVPLNGDQVWML